jgi:DNA-binding MarR family transcriptional regulator
MLSKAPVTGVVDRLERGDFVRRVADTTDRRVSRVVITPKGVKIWLDVRQTLCDNSRKLCDCFSPDEQSTLLDLLARLLDAAAAADPILKHSLSDGEPTPPTLLQPETDAEGVTS